MPLITRILVGAATFMVLDGLWLGLVMRHFYRSQLAPIARMANGGMAPNWTAAVVVYVALGLGIALLAVPRATDAASALRFGALLGLVVYAVYDFTNFSTLRQWPLTVTFVDTLWGVAATAVATLVVWTIAR